MLRTACSALALMTSLAWAAPVYAADETEKTVATAEVPPTPVTLPTSGPVIDLTPSLPVPAVAAPAEPQPATPTVQAASPVVAPPAFALAAEIMERLKRDKVTGGDREDRDAAVKFYEARQGEPLWVTAEGLTPRAQAVSAFIAAADDWGLSASAFKLPETKIAASADIARADLADVDVSLTVAALKYARHARGGRMDPTQLGKSIDRKAQLLSPATVLAELGKSEKPDATLRGYHPQHPQFEKLRQKYLQAKAGETVIAAEPVAAAVASESDKPGGKKKIAAPKAPPTPAAMQRRLLANLEQWRWMPEMGDTYITDNIPEFMVRVVRNGKLVHSERIVTGKPDTPTPIFSNEMQTVVFKPFWNVPESIKNNELLPQLVRSGGALAKAGLKAAYNGKEVNPAEVNWNDADMRQFHIFQPPGASNALGQVKFLFPNKHDVYMHDTPSKSLFNQSSRAFSHGCMRVRDPLKFAEVILSADKGWDMARVSDLANNGPENNEIRLTKKVPVHVTYFTTVVDDDGKLKTFNDVYSHEYKIHMGLEGKAHLIEQPREVRYVPPSRDRVALRQKSNNPIEDWMKSVFNF
jgi:L,D-transpeptidase YcbB